MNQRAIKFLILLVIVIAVLWWWWPDSSADTTETALEQIESELVSAIQTTNNTENQPDAQLNSSSKRLPEMQTAAPEWQASEEDQREFNEAVSAIQSGDLATGKSLLEGLIKRHPGLLEPYINLASAQAAEGDLNGARESLMRGLTANENFGALFGNLQQVHSTLAANAYQLALAESATPETSNSALTLPLVTSLNASVAIGDNTELLAAQSEIDGLRSNLTEQQKQVAKLVSEIEARDSDLNNMRRLVKRVESEATISNQATASKKIAELENELAAANQEIKSLNASHDEQVAALEQQIADQQSSIAQQQSTIAEQQSTISEQQQTIVDQRQLAAGIAATTPEQAASAPARTSAKPTASEARQQAIIDRVNSWAQAWGDQNVTAYLSHYQEGYTPPESTLNNRQWREQRRVRLTNKRFIEVTLSSFKTQAKGNDVTVTFVQRYRANSMDNTITKQLILRPGNQGWQDAKIINERVLR